MFGKPGPGRGQGLPFCFRLKALSVLDFMPMGEIFPTLLLASAILSFIDAAIYFGLSRKANPIGAIVKLLSSKDGAFTFILLMGDGL
ncbi:hypothetical protein [Oleomonas cavernae]|uniref:hypothetical protein n=1 Tax=Oleomonas cavernae TaxID=2320859 RepID=UPI0011C3DDC0|nr:hypothetical protein [Oleomonas cavernae]